MAKQVPWNKIILEEFISIACLSPIEEQIIRTRVAGWSRTKQAMTFGISISTLDTHIRTLKMKYDDAQKFSALLPPRKTSACEIYLDEH